MPTTTASARAARRYSLYLLTRALKRPNKVFATVFATFTTAFAASFTPSYAMLTASFSGLLLADIFLLL